jgi:ubiquinone/menaquinone biosynthesis C-methylase UbiE
MSRATKTAHSLSSARAELPAPPAQGATEALQRPPAPGGFLPFAASSADETTYLRQLIEQGGEAAQRYKAFSYELLLVEPGMQVLDIGCGAGADLLALAGMVGDGQVTGLDSNVERLQTARETTSKQENVRLIEGKAEQLPFPDETFHRCRADRVLLHIQDLHQAISEMARVLKPGGVAAVVEPDWKSIALSPASPAGGDDDHSWNAILHLCQRRLPHALVGRQFYSLFRQGDDTVWTDVHVEVRAYVLRTFQATNTILQIAQLAQALAQEDASFAGEHDLWLQTLERASRQGEFFASLPLYFVQARKRIHS